MAEVAEISKKEKSWNHRRRNSFTTPNARSINHQRRPIWLPRELSTIPRYQAVCVLDDGSSRATPEPHLVRFLKPEERKLVEPAYYKRRKITLRPILLAATPMPKVDENEEVVTKITESISDSDEEPKRKTPKSKTDAGKNPTGNIDTFEGEDD
jgi:hypothetical protein